MREVSVVSDFKNFSRAGMFKKRSLTSTDVPFTGGASFTDFTAPLLTSTSVPRD